MQTFRRREKQEIFIGKCMTSWRNTNKSINSLAKCQKIFNYKVNDSLFTISTIYRRQSLRIFRADYYIFRTYGIVRM